MKRKYFFDMDGTLSRFYKDPQFLDLMKKPGYFVNLEPYESMVEVIKQLQNMGCEVFILSAYSSPFEVEEKVMWLTREIPSIDCQHMLFCKAGTDKSLFVHSLEHDLTHCVLVDDYSKNLLEWIERGGKGFKCRNEINCKGEKWSGKRVDANDNASITVEILRS